MCRDCFREHTFCKMCKDIEDKTTYTEKKIRSINFSFDLEGEFSPPAVYNHCVIPDMMTSVSYNTYLPFSLHPLEVLFADYGYSVSFNTKYSSCTLFPNIWPATN